MTVTEVNIIPIKPDDGLIGFASCVINGQLFIGSLGVHQRLDGSGYRITYPTKKLGQRQLNYFHPITKEMGQAIEEAVSSKCVEIFERSDESHDRYSQTTPTSS